MDLTTLVGLLLLALVLYLIIFRSPRERYMRETPLGEACLAECPLSETDCLNLCDTWVEELSSGQRYPCPGFVSERTCAKADSF